jgi:hypothetical protein
MDSGLERRMFVRTTFASHNRSRVDSGTSRTIVRFILGKPRPDWERRIQLEAESESCTGCCAIGASLTDTHCAVLVNDRFFSAYLCPLAIFPTRPIPDERTAYNDIIILPIAENMNSGKTHAYFTWAAEHAWVPAPINTLPFSYTNQTSRPPALAPHDPAPLQEAPNYWVRPDFVVKADDDSFVMLAELEARLRVGLHSDLLDSNPTYEENTTGAFEDPLIYWGYLIKNKFMGGELYSLSWDVVTWVAESNAVKSLTHGAEDKLVARWMLLHPRSKKIRWQSEHCWIYDHPKAGTVYSHGFLFPSEAARVRQALTKTGQAEKKTGAPRDSDAPSHSSVCSFGTRYQPPANDLTPLQSVEALVEGSALSRIGVATANYGFRSGGYTADPATVLKRAVQRAWEAREGRTTRYEGKKLGGTVVVHFIKRNEWWEETALALLGGEDVGEGETHFVGSNTSKPWWVVSYPRTDVDGEERTSALAEEGTIIGREIVRL